MTFYHLIIIEPLVPHFKIRFRVSNSSLGFEIVPGPGLMLIDFRHLNSRFQTARNTNETFDLAHSPFSPL